MTATNLEIARALYRALAAGDAPALHGLLHPAYRGEVSAGMPHGFGGRYEGPDAMLGLWGRVASLFAVLPEPEEFLECADGRIVVTGAYRGKAARTGRPVDAVFAHVLAMESGQIIHLRQITDTQRWTEALAAPE